MSNNSSRMIPSIFSIFSSIGLSLKNLGALTNSVIFPDMDIEYMSENKDF